MPVALYRFLSIPKGFSYLNERGYVTKQLEKWHKVTYCWISFSLYVFILENRFEDFEIKVKYLNIHMKSGLQILLIVSSEQSLCFISLATALSAIHPYLAWASKMIFLLLVSQYSTLPSLLTLKLFFSNLNTFMSVSISLKVFEWILTSYRIESDYVARPLRIFIIWS